MPSHACTVCGTISPSKRCPAHPAPTARERKQQGLTGARGSTRQWRKLRAQVLERDRYLCQLQLPGCTTTATTADHKTPKSQGGRDTLDNLQAACAHCNGKKGSRA